MKCEVIYYLVNVVIVIYELIKSEKENTKSMVLNRFYKQPKMYNDDKIYRVLFFLF